MTALSKKRKPRRELSGLRPVATPADLRAGARRRFLASERLSLEELAAELGISRATAYRWAGNVEQLAGEVIATIVEDTHARTLREARGRGADRIVDSLARGMRYIAASAPYQAFLAQWGGADADIPILREARRESSRLRPQVASKGGRFNGN